MSEWPYNRAGTVYFCGLVPSFLRYDITKDIKSIDTKKWKILNIWQFSSKYLYAFGLSGNGVTKIKINSSKEWFFSPGMWRIPVILLLGGLVEWLAWGRESCWIVACVEQVSALSPASTWSSRRNPAGPGCLRRSEPGQEGNRAAKSSRVGQ